MVRKCLCFQYNFMVILVYVSSKLFLIIQKDITWNNQVEKRNTCHSACLLLLFQHFLSFTLIFHFQSHIKKSDLLAHALTLNCTHAHMQKNPMGISVWVCLAWQALHNFISSCYLIHKE